MVGLMVSFWIGQQHLETQFCEEPFVFACLVLLFELGSCLEAMCLALNWILQILNIHFVECDVRHAVSGWHDVIVVECLQRENIVN